MKFIVRTKGWCIAFIEGTEAEMKAKLAKFGIKVTESVPCRVENLGVIFTTEWHTECKCIGFDKELFSEMEKELYSVLENYEKRLGERGKRFPKNILENSLIHQTLKWPFEGRKIICKDIDVLVSEGEFHQSKEKNRCIFPRTYEKINRLSYEVIKECASNYIGVVLTKK